MVHTNLKSFFILILAIFLGFLRAKASLQKKYEALEEQFNKSKKALSDLQYFQPDEDEKLTFIDSIKNYKNLKSTLSNNLSPSLKVTKENLLTLMNNIILAKIDLEKEYRKQVKADKDKEQALLAESVLNKLKHLQEIKKKSSRTSLERAIAVYANKRDVYLLNRAISGIRFTDKEYLEKVIKQLVEIATKRSSIKKEIGELIVQLKNKLKNVPERINLFTQTESYLNPKHDKKWTQKDYESAIDIMLSWYKDFKFKNTVVKERFSNHSKTFRQDLIDMLSREREHYENYFAFYHGQDPLMHLVQKVYKAVAQYFYLLPKSQFSPRILASLFEHYPDIHNFLKKEHDSLDKSKKFNNYDKSIIKRQNKALKNNPKLSDFILSTNVTIFGNSFQPNPQTTLVYYLKGASLMPPPLKEILMQALRPFFDQIKKYNYDRYHSLRRQLFTIINVYSLILLEIKGSLLQIFIHKNAVDDLAYLSCVGGVEYYLSLGTYIDEEQSKKNFDIELGRKGDQHPNGRAQYISPLLKLLQTSPLLIDPTKQEYGNKEASIKSYNEYYFKDNKANTKDRDSFQKSRKDIYKDNLKYEHVKHFDLWQARVLAHPAYFANPNIVKTYNYNLSKINQDETPIVFHNPRTLETKKIPIKEAYTTYEAIIEGFLNDLITAWILENIQHGPFRDLQRYLNPKNPSLNEVNKVLNVLQEKKEPIFKLFVNLVLRELRILPIPSKKNYLHLAFECSSKAKEVEKWVPILNKLLDLGVSLDDKDDSGGFPLEYAGENLKKWIEENKKEKNAQKIAFYIKRHKDYQNKKTIKKKTGEQKKVLKKKKRAEGELSFLEKAIRTLKNKLTQLSKILNLSKTKPADKVALVQKIDDHASVWTKLSQGKKVSYKDKQELFIQDCKKLVKYNNNIPQHKKNENVIRLATYNVHYWANVDNSQSNYSLIKGILKNINADIVILQEVVWSGNFWNTNKKIQDTLPQFFKDEGYQAICFAQAGTFGGEMFGNLLISKYPFLDDPLSTIFKSNHPHSEQKRSLVKATIKLPKNKFISVYGTHLDVFDKSGKIREKQITELLDLASKDKNENIIITADFNEVREQDYQYKVNGKLVWDLLKAENLYYSGNKDKTPTSVARLIKEAGYEDCFSRKQVQKPPFTVWSGTLVDFIYVSKNWNLPITGCYAYYDSASDHIPIIMDFKLADLP